MMARRVAVRQAGWVQTTLVSRPMHLHRRSGCRSAGRLSVRHEALRTDAHTDLAVCERRARPGRIWPLRQSVSVLHLALEHVNGRRAQKFRHKQVRGVDRRPPGAGRSAAPRRPSSPRCMSEMLMASSWSWVTKTVVMPVSRWILANLLPGLQPQPGVQVGKGLVQQKHVGASSPAPGRWPPAAAGRRKAPRACAPSALQSAPASRPPGPGGASPAGKAAPFPSGSPAGTGCSAAPSDGDRGRNSETPCPRPGAPQARSVTSSSPKKTWPSVGVSRPQIMFSVVALAAAGGAQQARPACRREFQNSDGPPPQIPRGASGSRWEIFS